MFVLSGALDLEEIGTRGTGDGSGIAFMGGLPTSCLTHMQRLRKRAELSADVLAAVRQIDRPSATGMPRSAASERQ